MKKQDITYQDKLGELMLDIRHPNSKGKAFILLEGRSDVRLFRKLFNLNNCKVENVPGGNPKVEECVQTLRINYSLIIGIRDADFIHLRTIPYGISNIFLTDFHDMEMVLISTVDLFSALISEHTNLPKENHLELRNNILVAIEQIGYLKWLNDIEDLELNFQSGFQDLLSFANFSINFEEYFLRVLGKSPNAKITDEGIILQKIALLKNENPSPLQLSNGHDYFKALSRYIQQQYNVIVPDEHIASSCRMFYNFNHYQTSNLYQSTKQWADNNNCVIY